MLTTPLTIDREFPKRVYKSSLWLSGLIILFSLLFRDWPITWGFMIGAGISILFFKVLWWTVDQAFKRPRKKGSFFLLKILIIKFPLLAVFLYYAFTNFEINPFALIGGIAIIQAVMLWKAMRVVVASSTDKPLLKEGDLPSNPGSIED